jgi:flagellar hook-associated protein 1 FlgK
MINSFQPLNTITSGLILQQLEQEINANNIAQPSVDSQGYLMNSLEQVNSESNPSITFTGANGLLSVGTGASAESITRLRSSFLDNQIQQESTVVGYNEVLSNSNSTGIMNQISSILNGPTTLNSTLSSFAAQWGALASAASPASPTNANFASDQQNVVNAGVAFANAASSEFNQLQSLQLSTNNQINQTVGQINGLLQQLASINGQLLQTNGSTQNSLLDARDYALDKLSRLVNFQVNYGADGTANLWLSDVALLNGTTVSALQTTAENVNNPQLVDITLQVPGGTYSNETNVGLKSPYDITSLITGGNLGGEIYSRNVLLQYYKVQVDQAASSVINITNGIYSAGYVANGSVPGVTGIDFFTGTGASNIAVNGALVSAPTTLATEIQATSNPASIPNATPLPSGTLAGYLSNIPSLLANNYMASETSIGNPIDPTKSISSQTLSFIANSSFTLNGVSITYTDNNSINDILNEINTKVPGVYAVFNSAAGEFDFYSANPINFVGTSGDDFSWADLQNVLVSSFNLNNISAPDPKLAINVITPLNSTTVAALPSYPYGPNTEAYLVTPSTSGSFTISYVNAGVPTTTTINWNNTQSLNTILSSLPAPLNYLYLNNEQSFEIFSPSPIQIVDNSGNFTAFTGLNGNLALSGMVSNVSTNAASQNTTLQAAYTSSSDSLTQLNTEQDNLAGVSTGSGTPGVPIATIEQQAYQSMITYNAMLEVMQIIDQMLDALVGISSTTSSSGIFQQETKG